jgi:hypothetical protein
MSMSGEIIFAVEEAPEGGYVAHALGHNIFTEADMRYAVRACGALSFRRARQAEGDSPALRQGGSEEVLAA